MGRIVFYARLIPLLIALALAVTFMVLPWPNTLRRGLFDLVAVAIAALLGVRWWQYRKQRQNSSNPDMNQGDKWTSTN